MTKRQKGVGGMLEIEHNDTRGVGDDPSIGVTTIPPEQGFNLGSVHYLSYLRSQSWNRVVVMVVGFAHLAALMAFWLPFERTYLAVGVGMYLWFGFSVTLYLHRHLTHKGFEMAEPLRFLGALGAVVGLGGDPVGWVGDHRHHHRASDKLNDLHSPRHLGFWGAHMEWFLRNSVEFSAQTRELARDVRKDWYNRAFENPVIMFIPHILVACAVYTTLGWAGVCWAFYLPLVLKHHVTWSINSVCHLRWAGYRNHETSDDSVNVPLLGILALGEGYHNNHHASPRATAHGTRWFEVDPTKIVVWSLEKVGLVRNVVW
jgi:fatty-acid desaturase